MLIKEDRSVRRKKIREPWLRRHLKMAKWGSLQFNLFILVLGTSLWACNINFNSFFFFAPNKKLSLMHKHQLSHEETLAYLPLWFRSTGFLSPIHLLLAVYLHFYHSIYILLPALILLFFFFSYFSRCSANLGLSHKQFSLFLLYLRPSEFLVISVLTKPWEGFPSGTQRPIVGENSKISLFFSKNEIFKKPSWNQISLVLFTNT